MGLGPAFTVNCSFECKAETPPLHPLPPSHVLHTSVCLGVSGLEKEDTCFPELSSTLPPTVTSVEKRLV